MLFLYVRAMYFCVCVISIEDILFYVAKENLGIPGGESVWLGEKFVVGLQIVFLCDDSV